MSALQDAKLVLMGVTDLEKDALHLHIGLAAFFSSALLLRGPTLITAMAAWTQALSRR